MGRFRMRLCERRRDPVLRVVLVGVIAGLLAFLLQSPIEFEFEFTDGAGGGHGAAFLGIEVADVVRLIDVGGVRMIGMVGAEGLGTVVWIPALVVVGIVAWARPGIGARLD